MYLDGREIIKVKSDRSSDSSEDSSRSTHSGVGSSRHNGSRKGSLAPSMFENVYLNLQFRRGTKKGDEVDDTNSIQIKRDSVSVAGSTATQEAHECSGSGRTSMFERVFSHLTFTAKPRKNDDETDRTGQQHTGDPDPAVVSAPAPQEGNNAKPSMFERLATWVGGNYGVAEKEETYGKKGNDGELTPKETDIVRSASSTHTAKQTPSTTDSSTQDSQQVSEMWTSGHSCIPACTPVWIRALVNTPACSCCGCVIRLWVVILISVGVVVGLIMFGIYFEDMEKRLVVLGRTRRPLPPPPTPAVITTSPGSRPRSTSGVSSSTVANKTLTATDTTSVSVETTTLMPVPEGPCVRTGKEDQVCSEIILAQKSDGVISDPDCLARKETFEYNYAGYYAQVFLNVNRVTTDIDDLIVTKVEGDCTGIKTRHKELGTLTLKHPYIFVRQQCRKAKFKFCGTRCPKGWVYVTTDSPFNTLSSCYKYFDQKKVAFADTENVCENDMIGVEGAYVFSPKFKYINERMAKLNLSKGKRVWLGINMPNGKPIWADKTELNYTNWKSIAPDPLNAWCGAAFSVINQNASWTIEACGTPQDKLHYICELPLFRYNCSINTVNDPEWKNIIHLTNQCTFKRQYSNFNKTQAQSICTREGSHLPEPRSKLENTFITKIPSSSSPSISDVADFWIGINRSSSGGKFVYESDGNKLKWNFTSLWKNGSPGNGECVISENEYNRTDASFVNRFWIGQNCSVKAVKWIVCLRPAGRVMACEDNG